jgi:hypothetical protein
VKNALQRFSYFLLLLLQGLANHGSKHASNVSSVGRVARCPVILSLFCFILFFRGRGRGRQEGGIKEDVAGEEGDGRFGKVDAVSI